MDFHIKKYSNKDFDALSSFISLTERLFNPPISQRVNLTDYINKLAREAVIFFAISDKNNNILGTIAYYCTPGKYNYAFLSYIASNSIIKGIGSELVRTMIKDCVEKKMKGIEAQTWESNIKSLLMFHKFGFKEVGKTMNRDNNERSILLKLDFQ